MEFKEIVKKRYATKKFTGEKISQEQLDELLEIIRFAPSSYGLQQFKVKIVVDDATKEKLKPAAYNQDQITTCSHLLIFCADTDVSGQAKRYGEMMKEKGFPDENIAGFEQAIQGYLNALPSEAILPWTQRQTYLALANAVNGAKSLGFDSCPMEGFNPEEFKNILDLPEHLHPVALCAVGFAADKEPPKIRFPKGELFF